MGPGPFVLFPLLAWGLASMLPFFWILPRYGIPRVAAVLCTFPLFAYLAIWMVALRDPKPINDGGLA